MKDRLSKNKRCGAETLPLLPLYGGEANITPVFVCKWTLDPFISSVSQLKHVLSLYLSSSAFAQQFPRFRSYTCF